MPLALYRKYRPKTLSDMVGQETSINLLKNAAKEGRLGHAYLFYGSRGTGKTTTARLLAKLLNCEKRANDPLFEKQGEPCNQCQTCLEIDVNASLDVIEIDDASNRGIDEIRNLKDSIKTSPAKSSHKVYIIDEAHMLTGAAFNALLKTLEEPPLHGVIVLATTEYEKLPPTITSRTQRFLFKKLSKVMILEKLSRIAKEEGIKIEPGAMELIAAAGEGSLRDAESLLDQMRSSGKEIDLQAVERMTGRIGFKKVEELSALILKDDLAAALRYISSVSEEGQNLVQMTKDLIHYLRKILALKVSPGLEELFQMELTGEEIAAMKKLCALMDAAKGTRLLRALIRAYSEMRYSPFAGIPLEIVLTENLTASPNR